MVGHRGCALGVSLVVLALTAASPSLAQTPPAATADPNVTSYAPAFFAEFRPVTAMDMIGRIPGFQFDGGSNARGFAGTAGNVLIDGERPPTRSDALSTVLSRIPAAQVLRIDIVRSGAGGIDMQGKPVVANVIRRPDAGVSGAWSVSTGVSTDGLLSPSVSIQAQRQRDGRSIEGSIRYSMGEQAFDGYRERLSPSGVPLLIADRDGGVEYTNGEATTVYEGPLAGGRIRANALINHETSTFASTDRLLLPLGEERNLSEDEELKLEGGLRWTRALPLGALELVGFQQLTWEDGVSAYDTPFFTSDTVSDERAGESIISAALKFASAGDWSFETGTEVALNWVESSSAYAFNNSPVLIAGDDTRVEELRSESFVTGLWAPSPELSLETTLRYELSRITASGSGGDAETELSYLKPRLNLTWLPAPRHTVTVKLERNVDQLSFGAFNASAAFNTGIFGIGNPDIRPAQIWLLSARYERTWARQGSFIVEATHEELEDVLGSVIVFAVPPGGTTPQPFNITRNVGPATRDLIRFTGRVPLDDWGITGGLVSGQIYWRRSETEDPVTFVDRRLNGETPFAWAISLSQNLVQQRMSWSLAASSGIETRSYAPRTTSTYETTPNLSASVTWRPDPTLSLSGTVSVGQDQRNSFTLFDLPRDVGSPVYTEFSRTPGTIQANLSLRRSF